jgi:hypothetical protein
MRAKGMINVELIEEARRGLASAGADLVSGMLEFLPAAWPPHRYDALLAPDGAWNESTIDRSAPHYPGQDVRVPEWTENGASYDFGEAEGDKVTLFNNWLFTRKGVDYLADWFGFDPGLVFVPFGAKADRSFEGGKFPRDQWKAGSFDVELWQTGRFAIARAASAIMYQIDALNAENVVLSPRDWIITKFVEGPVVGGTGQTDTTFANMPELLEDVVPSADDFPAYTRVSDVVDPTDPTWTAAGASFARAKIRFELLMGLLSGGGFAQDYFDQCFTVWRTGSQTHRRDQ